MDNNSLRVTNQKNGKWSCDQKGKLSNRTTTSVGEVGTSGVHLTSQLWVYKVVCFKHIVFLTAQEMNSYYTLLFPYY